jgi:hypothetical protein
VRLRTGRAKRVSRRSVAVVSHFVLVACRGRRRFVLPSVVARWPTVQIGSFDRRLSVRSWRPDIRLFAPDDRAYGNRRLFCLV